jgi:GntR family transcriptional regulator
MLPTRPGRVGVVECRRRDLSAEEALHLRDLRRVPVVEDLISLNNYGTRYCLMIEFRLNPRSGVPTYLQLVQQTRQAIRLGLLRPGDQLPTVKEVVGHLAINPNTVLKAYRELDHEGLVEGRRGQGTFVARTVEGATHSEHAALRQALERWIGRARAAGLDDEDLAALVASTMEHAFTAGPS